MKVHVVGVQVVLVQVERLEEMPLFSVQAPSDPAIGIACFGPQVRLLSESVLRHLQSPRRRLLLLQ